MKTIIITWEQYQDQELIYPFFRAKEEGEVALFANKKGRVYGILGAFVTATHEIALLQDTETAKKYLAEFDLLILPGGVKAMEKLRQERCVTQFVASWDRMGKTIASTCSGAQLLISAEMLKGRKVSAYYAMETDIKNAGATYVNEACVIDKNLISSPHYDHMSIWLSTAIKQVQDKA